MLKVNKKLSLFHQDELNCVMISRSIIFLFTLTNAAFQGFSQSKTLPAEATPFVLSGYEMMDYITGDLNGDKRADAILILRTPGEDSIFEDTLLRPFIILLRQPNGKLKKEKQSDNMVMCRHCGGIFGDPYEETKIYDKGFTINFYGGSNLRWMYQYTFTYNATKKNWLLNKEMLGNYATTDPEMNIKEVNIGAAELEGINFDNFNAGALYEDSKWKVIAAKTYFYDSPGLNNKPRKAYLLKGDEVIGIRQLKNFVEISFQNKKEQFTTGYVLKKDLSKIK